VPDGRERERKRADRARRAEAAAWSRGRNDGGGDGDDHAAYRGGERERIERVERLLITPREVIASWRERASERTGDKKGDG